ncbi:MAG: 4-hydroxythreonine-4-phosphate dehydrogenase PdxA [Bacteroidota bacterium]
MIPRIAITIGDFNGVGPEITLKALSRRSLLQHHHFILIGPFDIFQFFRKKFRYPVSLEKVTEVPKKYRRAIPVLDIPTATAGDISIGRLSSTAGLCAGRAIEYAANLCRTNVVDAMVTAPISKEALNAAGFGYPGQTEMLSALSGNQKVVMMLISQTMRVGLVTIHLPLRDVSSTLSIEKIFETTVIVDFTLRHDFSIRTPSIALLALNPHASEEGLIGNEDLTIVKPAVEFLRLQNLKVSGPFPADGFFSQWFPNRYDAVIAMYHDQGLIPLKMTARNSGVNFSAGLQIIRTSPDHGTAFEIAGKNIANPNSMVEAIVMAGHIACRRKLHSSRNRPTIDKSKAYI